MRSICTMAYSIANHFVYQIVLIHESDAHRERFWKSLALIIEFLNVFRSINVTKSLLLGQKDLKTSKTIRHRSTSVLKIFLNLLKNYISVNYNISSSFQISTGISRNQETGGASMTVSLNEFRSIFSTLPNLYKSKPIWPNFMQHLVQEKLWNWKPSIYSYDL